MPLQIVAEFRLSGSSRSNMINWVLPFARGIVRFVAYMFRFDRRLNVVEGGCRGG